jgi:uncharacterized repeat protein (TIGR03843 family)
VEPTERSGWIELLTHGTVELVGRMPWSSNATFLVRLDLDGTDGQGVYKPERGEQPLMDFPSQIYRREVAAYELSNALGFGLVPETVVRSDAPYGEGSIQRFIHADYEQHYFTLREDPEFESALRELAGLDLLLNNADRKGGHVLRSVDDVIFGIDNGLSFHVRPKLRTVMWDYAGEPLPEQVREAAQSLTRDVPERVRSLIDPFESEALVHRATDLSDVPFFPIPDPNRRIHPWPIL